MTLEILYALSVAPEKTGCGTLMGLIDSVPVSPMGSVV